MKAILSSLDISAENLIQVVKWIVYCLLLVNFAQYIRNDWDIAAHTMRNGGALLEWTRSFATTIDESAWIVLLILFELETYVLSDEPLSRPKEMLMLGARILCYGSLAHTLYAYGSTVFDLRMATPIEGVTDLCQLVGKEISYAANLVYTELNADNCAALSSAPPIYYIDPPQFVIVTDSADLVVEKQLAWLDIMEATTWLLILFSIEVVVWLQDRGIGKGAIISSLNSCKLVLYTLLWVAIAYWIYRGHYMFAWDEFVWIAGFAAIEMNVVEWRSEIVEAEDSQTAASAVSTQ
ncbi:MAG: hypothetical protein HOC23_13680 [Halieaceae bacterium]|nr:hypothetical protein [Halieaceae bacterium]